MAKKLSGYEKLSVAGGFVLFLIVAVGVSIDSNSAQSQLLYHNKPALEAAAAHIFFGLVFAIVVISLMVVALIAVVFILGLVILYILLVLDRIIKPLNAVDAMK